MRRALVVGIDHYDKISPLKSAVKDANAVTELLARNANGTANFGVRLLTASDSSDTISRRTLRDSVQELFTGSVDVALLYFSGHGHSDDTGGYICASDSVDGDDGLSLNDIMTYAGQSSIKNKVIILDSCFSGAAANRTDNTRLSEIHAGTTIMTASALDQLAYELPGGEGGVFTNLFLDALNGAAANLVGKVSPGSVYAHIDQSLGEWGQRPVFKTNVQEFISLRSCEPPIAWEDLRDIVTLFPDRDYEFSLDPTFEPERSNPILEQIAPPDPTKTPIFRTLQQLVRVNLVRPVDAPHMWHAAIYSKSCRLTPLGEHYRNLIINNKL